MVTHIEGQRLADEHDRYAVVVSRYNETVTRRLLDGALETFGHHGLPDDQLTVIWVPGAFEIPMVADQLAKSGDYAAVVCLGAVIQGETEHHEYINQQVAAAIMRAGLDSSLPVLFGVLTCPSMQAALDRAGGKVGNKGSEAALAAIEMVDILRQLSPNESGPF